MIMNLYQKLKEKDVVEDYKDFVENIWIRSIKINNIIIDDPNKEFKDGDKIQIGILSLD